MKRSLSLILLIAFLYCTSCTPQQLPIYTIDSEMATDKWGGSRKLKAGDVIIIEQFQAYPHHKGLTGPFANRMRIPIRLVGELGSLKDYEKNFLLTVIGSNAEKEFNEPDFQGNNASLDIMRKELIKMWNTLMSNIYVVSQANKYKKIDIEFDWSQIPASSPFHKTAPKTTPKSRIVAMPRDHYSLYDYFDKSFNDTGSNAGYYVIDTQGLRVPHNYVNFSVEINGIIYGNYKSIYEESTWSVYDWLYSESNAIPGMKDKKNIVKRIGIKGVSGSFRILPTSRTVSHEVSYKDGYSNFLKKNYKKGKTLSEADLLNISPKMLKKIKFKKSTL